MNDAPVNLIGDAMKSVLLVENRLRSLAGAFWATGNQQVHATLYEMVDMLEAARKDAMNTAHRWADREFKNTEQATANVLSAVLAGTVLAKRNEGYRLQSEKAPEAGMIPMKQCDKHKVLLYSDEVCHDCYEETRDPGA